MWPCSSTCIVQDVALPASSGQQPEVRHLGLGRHALVGSDKGAAVAFVVSSAGETKISLARFDAQGSYLGTLPDVASGGGSDLWGHPVVAALDAGDYVVGWTDRFLDGDQLAVGLRKIGADGNPSTLPLLASSQKSFIQRQVDLVWTGSAIVAAWVDESDPFTGPDLKFRLFDAELVPQGPESSLASSEAAEGAVVLAALGTSWAAAWRAVADGQETIVVRTAAEVSWSFGPFKAGSAEERPALIAIDEKKLLLAFSAIPGEGKPTELYLATLNIDSPDAAPSQIFPSGEAPTMFGQRQPSLTRFQEQIFLAWETGGEPGTEVGEELWLRPLLWDQDAGTLPLTGPDFHLTRQKAHRPGDQRKPALAFIGGGLPSLVAAWEDVGSGTTENSNAAQIFVQFTPLPFHRDETESTPENNAILCSNGLDDDGNGLADCQEPGCTTGGFCSESSLAACSNGLDDNNNGLIDCSDPDCSPFCETSAITCHDGLDNDGDGQSDCAEFECSVFCEASASACSDTFDNDGDQLVDCNDPDCINGNFCETSLASCSDGLDNDNDGNADCDDTQCLLAGVCSEDSIVRCHDLADDDGDGKVDCADPDCAAFCETSVAACNDGLDNDGDGQIDCDDFECAVQFVCPELVGTPACDNFIDDDKDGLIDISDPGCLFQ